MLPLASEAKISALSPTCRRKARRRPSGEKDGSQSVASLTSSGSSRPPPRAIDHTSPPSDQNASRDESGAQSGWKWKRWGSLVASIRTGPPPGAVAYSRVPMPAVP